MSPEVQQHFSDHEYYPGSLLDYSHQENVVTINASSDTVLKIYGITDEILRFRYSTDGYFENDFSYALDPKFEGNLKQFNVDHDVTDVIIITEAVICKVKKANLSITIYDHNGNIIVEDEKGFHWEVNNAYGGNIVMMSKKVQRNEAFYGLGDKPTDLNLKGKRFENWGTDNYGYSKNTDPLYKSIPIYYGLHDGIGYGMFFDNTFRAYFDFGSERNNALSFWAQGGEMNYYFIAGPSLLDACRRYTLLTGTPEMPPLWSLGFQQCKWSYYPESQVRDICKTMRDYEIPCDAIYLDIDYMDGFRCFTWDNEKFPAPKEMIADLKKDGFKTMVIIDPGIKVDKDYWVFKEGLENGYFCRRPDGPFVMGKVWPGECYFPDFTNPEVREWWGGLYKELIEHLDVAGVWNDMNEPALFEVESKTFPNDVLHDYDGNLCSHRKAHNIYGMQMARATADGVKKFANGRRSLIITRSGYSGMQRFSSVWTGDNIASIEHLWLASVQAQRLSISGVSFAGSDIGGFIETPSGELFIRWIQLGIFHPFCRVHSSGDHGDQEPWSFGDEYTQLFKRFVEIRYQLLGYIYTSFYDYHKNGTPMLRPIVFYDQYDQENVRRDHEFLCGPDILVLPVLNQLGQGRNIYLPQGEWYDYWNNDLLQGKQHITKEYSLEDFPFFIKAGAVIPIYPIQQYVGEFEIEQIELRAYYSTSEYSSQLYDDAQNNYDYENGDYRLSTFGTSGSDKSFTIDQEVEGNYNSKINSYTLSIIGLPFEVTEVKVDGKSVDFELNKLVVPSSFKKVEIL
jgi:alpha-glucosidase